MGSCFQTEATSYHCPIYRRLAAAWPPILSGHVPDSEIDALVAAAAQVMMDAGGVMTSRLIEFSAFDSGIPEPFRGRAPPA